MMIALQGKSVFQGVAIGRLCLYQKKNAAVKRHHIDDVAAEKARFEAAKSEAASALRALHEKALEEVGEANAMIFEIHQMMLEDLDYCESISNIMETEEVNAEYAVAVTADNFEKMFSSMDDAYMQGRAADVKDVSERLLGILQNTAGQGLTLQEPAIIGAEDLAPSETVQLDKEKVLGFVTEKGSANSHTAILARTMSIPAVIGVAELKSEYDGKTAVIDGFTGTVYIEPDEATLASMQKKQQADLEQKALLHTLKGKENVTLDGTKINIYANIGNLSDLGAVLQNDAGGIGLFRSEFLYLEKQEFPTEDELFAAYKTVAQSMGGKRVIIRTLDIGADKQAAYFGLPKEENPALGFRAIRICLADEALFKTQLRAILRASAFGEVAIMFPMIISVWEVRRAKELLHEAAQELEQAGIPYQRDMEVGVMIETPAAVMLSEELAQEVDFFSVGTNDLTQYTLAIDRQNQRLEPFYDAHHPAVLRMIRLAAESAHNHGIWIGICGELGADPSLTETFLQMGIDEISVSPSCILNLRKIVREIRLNK